MTAPDGFGFLPSDIGDVNLMKKKTSITIFILSTLIPYYIRERLATGLGAQDP